MKKRAGRPLDPATLKILAWRFRPAGRTGGGRSAPSGGPGEGRSGQGFLEAFALHALAQQLAVTAHRFGPLPLLAGRRLLEIAAEFHFPEDTLALQFLFQRAQGLIDVVVTNLNLHRRSVLLSDATKPRVPARLRAELLEL